MITQSQLKELLHYDPITGVFTWNERPLETFKTNKAFNSWNARFSNTKAGTQRNYSGKKYVFIKAKDKSYRAHRLAWLYMTGSFPKEQIDHIDGNGLNNSFANLRSVTQKENAKNLKLSANNSSGFTGVTWDVKQNKWRAGIQVNKKYIYLGAFTDIADAISARKEANIKHGFHENHGRNHA